ncbi:PP2C family protein-serine/threonine phosphatase [Actinocatenispora rupis]|uniref:Membrane protein n=2 Tax=Actinocatenispora rupis TaxID=519421 RepID=A0A8J3JB64_9ACTN|nr:PP2C family protein-serine/threonine phosphatase [Actinocatenispora rupis]GID13332.1 membrane protein [Actinocatenispora rupis]
MRPDARAGLGAALVLLVLIVSVELADGRNPSYVGLLATPPFLAAAFGSWRTVLPVGLVSVVLATMFWLTAPTGPDTAVAVNVVAVLFASGIAAAVGAVRQRQVERFAALSRLASVAQQAILGPLGPRVGNLPLAARYVSASAEADIGGDLYEAVDTTYGVRLLIGDVRGKGLDAVRLASIVLGSYRHVAYERADLRAILADLDRAVARSVGLEDFVTAALLEERGGTLTVLNCGHPAPLLLRRGQAIPLDPPAPAPPLGFMPLARPRVQRLEPGDRILLYTDGLAEARRNGEFFPIEERAWGLLGHGTVQDGLASLEAALIEWVNGILDDDIALVLLEYTGASRTVGGSTPSWELGDGAANAT